MTEPLAPHAAPQGASDAPPQPAPPEQPPAAEPRRRAQSPATFQLDADKGPTYKGVPLFDFSTPFGGQGVGILTAVDLDASHEAGQRKIIPGTDPVQFEDVPKSGGRAEYMDFTSGKGWSVPLNPEGSGS